MREIEKTRGVFADKVRVADEKDYVKYVISELTDEIEQRQILGLCAPQLGYYARIICLKVGDTVKEFVNPVIKSLDNVKFIKEKSLSLDNDDEYLVPRFTDIVFYYQDKNGKMEECALKEIAATTFLQLYDILMGLFIDDIYEKVPDNFDSMTEEEVGQYIKDYSQRLEDKDKQVSEEIEGDEELKEFRDKLEAFKVLSLAETKSRLENKNLNRQKRRELQRIVDRKRKKKK